MTSLVFTMHDLIEVLTGLSQNQIMQIATKEKKNKNWCSSVLNETKDFRSELVQNLPTEYVAGTYEMARLLHVIVGDYIAKCDKRLKSIDEKTAEK